MTAVERFAKGRCSSSGSGGGRLRLGRDGRRLGSVTYSEPLLCGVEQLPKARVIADRIEIGVRFGDPHLVLAGEAEGALEHLQAGFLVAQDRQHAGEVI